MDEVHRPEEKTYVSPLVSINKFFTDARATACMFRYNFQNPESDLARQIGCDLTVLSELDRLCNPEKLKCGQEDEDDALRPFAPDVPLAVLSVQRSELQKRDSDLYYRQAVNANLKYKRYNFRALESHQMKPDETQRINYDPPDVVMTVQLLRPYNRSLEGHEIRLGRLLAMDVMFLVRGQTLLSELRDKIQCSADYATWTDLSENPRGTYTTAMEAFPSSFFFINNVFYNDNRNPNARDLSQPITDWCKRRKTDLDATKFQVSDMSQVRFRDLSLRLGQPYLYLHQGHCEHLLLFTDLRLLHRDDCQNLATYPILVSSKMKKRTACCACKRYTAKWVTYSHSRLPFDPGFWCDICFFSFNYDSNGAKIGDFQAVPYYDKSAMD